MENVVSYSMSSIGYFKGSSSKKYDVPRQANLNPNLGEVILHPNNNFEQALSQLSGFSHIWLIYLFDNMSWKPMVQTPRSLTKKGVFATRSPYRPNPIGMSCVELIQIKGLKLQIKNYDLMNNTQILDIKPYLEYSDKINFSQQGWLDDLQKFEIEYSPNFKEQLCKKFSKNKYELLAFIESQLSYAPINHPNKRIKAKELAGHYILSYQYFRIHFQIINFKVTCTQLKLETLPNASEP